MEQSRSMSLARRLPLVLTVLNLVILILSLTLRIPPVSATPTNLPILRGSALEIVDAQGRVRASISVHEPTVVNGVPYPETVLLRLTDPKNGPVVKMTANINGSALGLSDDADGGIQLFARDDASYVKIVGKQGQERVIKP